MHPGLYFAQNMEKKIFKKSIALRKYNDFKMFIFHSALKLEKSAISKVQKHIFCHFKNGKKSIFAQKKV